MTATATLPPTKYLDDGKACTVETCTAGVCQRPVLRGWCHIDNQCWRAGDYNPYDYYQYCDPARSQTYWTYDSACYGSCKPVRFRPIHGKRPDDLGQVRVLDRQRFLVKDPDWLHPTEYGTQPTEDR